MDAVIGYTYLQFAAKLCHELDKTKNFVFSPLMANEVLRVAKALGTIIPLRDVTSKTVQLCSDDSIPVYPNLVYRNLKLIKGVKFIQACKVYLHTAHYKLEQNQKKEAMELYHVKIKNINFCDRVSAAELINKSFEKKIKGKIKGSLTYKDFEVDTNVILVSGLYFKSHWHMKFDADDTEETIFYLNNNETVNLFLMHKKENFTYKDSAELDSQLLLLPFKGKDVNMLIVLPKRYTGLDKVLEKLADGYDLMADIPGMSDNVEVNISIPRFTIESNFNVMEVFQNTFGITTIFDKALQKVVVAVNEEGSTPKPTRMTCGFIPRWKPRPIDFVADHPHLIVIIYENVPIVWITFRGRFE